MAGIWLVLVRETGCFRPVKAHTGSLRSATDLSISLWDLGSGRKIKSMTGHTAPINSLAFTACTTMLVSGSSDWTVRCWDVKGAGGTKPKALKLNVTKEDAWPNGTHDEKEDIKEQT